ncbi:unnamed protein product [Brassica rapa]|uniref:Uncharacterized protein n=1 Tax=Brassica campestris TaxID=3711 RepID=A0A8D9LTU8_BRACM|nr:unnamed protein product [Brassica rapa]
MKVAFGGVEPVSQQPPRQPEQTGILSSLALPGVRDDWCFVCEFETHVEKASQSRFSFSSINDV